MNIYDRIINMFLESRIEDYLERLDEVGKVKTWNKLMKKRREVTLDRASGKTGATARTEKAHAKSEDYPHNQPNPDFESISKFGGASREAASRARYRQTRGAKS